MLGLLEGCAQGWLSRANFGGLDLKGKIVKRGLGKTSGTEGGEGPAGVGVPWDKQPGQLLRRVRRRWWTCLGEPPQREVSQELDQVDEMRGMGPVWSPSWKETEPLSGAPPLLPSLPLPPLSNPLP